MAKYLTSKDKMKNLSAFRQTTWFGIHFYMTYVKFCSSDAPLACLRSRITIVTQKTSQRTKIFSLKKSFLNQY